MLNTLRARAEARALLSVIPTGVAAGALIGLALGGAYLAGGMARDAVTHAKVSRVADQAVEGFSEDSLRVMAENDPGALSVALRYDPALLADYSSLREHQTLKLAQKLEDRTPPRAKPSTLFMRASYSPTPAAQPYHATALDQSRQLDCLTQAVYYEARGETPAGQAAVAQVVLNRVRHPAFPKSICAVVYQGAQGSRGCQFSFACDGSLRRTRETGAWTRAERIASRALEGYVMAEVGNATHFHVTGINPGWGNLLQVARVGTHIFYRFGGRAGKPDAFTAQPQEDVVIAQAPALSETLPMAASLVILPAETATASTPPAASEPVAQVRTTPAA